MAVEPHSRLHSPSFALHRPKVAYLVSRFPKLTETFVLFEILAVEQQGAQVELYPLLREHAAVMHSEAAGLLARAHFQPFMSRSIWQAQWYFLRRKPLAYLGALWALLRGTWGSLRFLAGGLAIFPKSVYFARHMLAGGISHVHAHFASHPAAAAFIIHRLTGLPYSFTAHGSDLHRDQHMLREKVGEAKFVATISNYNQELILAKCGEQFRDRVRVIRCGVDPQVFRPRSRHSGSRTFTILCIGTLHEVKGQTYLIEAARLLQDQGIEFVCHLIGDGPDREKLARQIAQAGLGQRVHLHGQRTRQQIAEWLGQADVVVAPSVPTRDGRREGIPVVLIEALGSGVPVVASRISGIPELVEHELNGLLVPIREARALAEALRRLQRDPELRQSMGERGREKVEREFNLHSNAAALIQGFLREEQR